MNFQVLPQFFNNSGHLDIVATSSTRLVVKILDIQGRIAKTIIEKVDEGVHQLSINLSDLQNGMYVLNAFCGDKFIKAIRFLKN